MQVVDNILVRMENGTFKPRVRALEVRPGPSPLCEPNSLPIVCFDMGGT